MWNPFKRKHLVPIDDCFNAILEAIKKDDCGRLYTSDIWTWLEENYGVKRKWKWRESKNYLVFDSEHDYMMFLLKL